jgi:hypothetical protein
MQEEPVPAMLSKEPTQGYQVRAPRRIPWCLGGRAERLGLVSPSAASRGGVTALEEPLPAPPRPEAVQLDTGRPGGGPSGGCRKSSGSKPGLAESHLKLVAAAQAGFADPARIVDAKRRELLRLG